MELIPITEGTVEQFIENINLNFDTIKTNKNITRQIIISKSTEGGPTGGNPGDIWIVYEE